MTKKFRLALPLLLLSGSCPKSGRASSRQCPKFHPNPFTSGGVIAGAGTLLKRAIKCFQYSAKLFAE